jgi:hypothetical protein
MKMEQTEVSKTSTLSIHTPGNYPKEEITRSTALFTGNEMRAMQFSIVLFGYREQCENISLYSER